MWRRWRAYLIGVGLGILIVYFSLIRGRDRDFDFWLPGPRVLTELEEKFDQEDDSTTCLLNCYQVFPTDIELMWKEASVNFSKSEVSSEPKVYYVTMEFEGKGLYEFKFISGKDKATIREIRTTNNSSNCDCVE